MRDDGVVFICDLTDTSVNGRMPVEVLEPVSKYWFQLRTVGINRQYMAKGVNEQVDLLLSVPFDPSIRIGQYAMLGNGEQYRIDTVSHFRDETELRRTEIALSRVEEYYAVDTQ